MEKTWFYEIIVMVKDEKDGLWKIQYQSKLFLYITGITLHGQE